MGKFLSAAATTAGRIEKGLCYAALVLMALLPTADALLRPFNIAISFSRPLMIHLFLVAGLLAGMITTRAKEHIAIAIVQYAKNERAKKTLAFFTGMVSTFVATILFWDSISFIKYSPSGSGVASIPDTFFTLVMPIAYGVIAIRFAMNLRLNYPAAEAKTERTNRQEIQKNSLLPSVVIPVLVILLGSAAALPAIAKIVWGFEPPEPYYSGVNFIYNIILNKDGFQFAWLIRISVILFLVVAAISGTPIFAAIGGIALVMLQATGGEPEAVPIQIYSALTNSDLIAIPLFTLTGFFLSESKAGERLVATFRSLFSWLPGGMIIATVVICAFFTSFTGASGVTILALGGILYTILKEKLGYPEKFSIGLLTSVGCIGLLFPPSLPIILVGSTTNSILYFMGETINYSIVDFFLGAIIPGIILMIAMIAFGIIASVKVKIPVERFNLREAGSAVKGSIFEILLPVILIGGFFSGILSLVEVSAVSVIYVFITEVLIHRDIALKDLPKVFYKAIPIIGGILSILAMAKALSYAIIDSQVPEQFAVWMRHTVESKYLFLLILNLALLALGCVMDMFSAILVILPLIVPLGQVYGIDPVHLGIIFIINLEVGFLTPPVGINLFLSSYRFNRSFTQICRFVLPFIAVQIAIVLLVTYVPGLCSFLPGLFK